MKAIHKVTTHAAERMSKRSIPPEMVLHAIENGRRVVLPDRQAYRYELNNVLGMRGKHLVVIQGFNGKIITSYIEKRGNKIKKS